MTHRSPKALRAKIYARSLLCFAKAFGVRMRPRAAFASALCYATINETNPQAWAPLRSSSPALWRIAVLFILAVHSGAANRRSRGNQFAS